MKEKKEIFMLFGLIVITITFLVIMCIILSFMLGVEHRTIQGDVLEVNPHIKNGKLLYLEIIFEDGTIIEAKPYSGYYGADSYDLVKSSTLIIEFSSVKDKPILLY